MYDKIIHLSRRLMQLVGRARVTLVDDTGPVQIAQIDRGPTGSGGSLAIRDKTPIVQPFGLSANPPAGADVIVLSVGGDFINAVGFAASHQSYRPKNLQPGDTCLYDVRSGQTVVLSGNGITVTDQWGNTVTMAHDVMTLTHSTKVVVNAPDVELAGTGGAAVARVGDNVNLTTGKIVSGSSKVKAN